MVAGSGDAEHGGGTGATSLEERVGRLEKDVERLREQVRTHAQAQVRAIAETQFGAGVETPTETPGEAATPTEERPAPREIVSTPFAEASRNPVWRGGGNARERGPRFRLFPAGLPPATWWVARAGVVLLLVGVSFLLRMGVEQGWLTPAVRVVGGVIIGVALSAFGLGARTSRPAYSQVLVGGGVVAFYLSAFGAWSVWQLVPYGAAFAFCVLTTAFAFAAAVRLSADWLALLGIVGGYATPFMLLSPHSNVPALVAYSLLLLGGYLMVYVSRGWRSVYVAAIFGVWAILTVSDLGARTYTTSIAGVLPTDAAWSVSTGALVAWLTILFLTSARRYLLEDGRASATASVAVSISSENGGGGVLTEAAATSVAPLVALLFAWSAWTPENPSGVYLASLAVAMALIHLISYAVVANKALLSPSSSVAGTPRGRQGNGGGQTYGGFFETSALAGLLEDRSAETSRGSYGGPSRDSSIALALRYARTQAFAAVVLLTLAVVFLLDGVALASALAVEGALLAYLVRPAEVNDTAPRLSGRRLITAKSWLLLTFAALYSLGTVAWRATDPFGVTGGDAAYLPFLNGDVLSLLAVVASLFFVGRMGEGVGPSPWRGVAAGARLCGHLLFALGVVSELARSDLPSGASFVFLALYALALALARFVSDRNLPTTGEPHLPSPALWRPPSWVASWLDVGAVLCVIAPWLWERLDASGMRAAYASQALSEPGAHLANLVGIIVLFGVAGLLFLWGNARRGPSTAWEDESLLPPAAVLLLAASTFFALYWTWRVLDPLLGGSALVSVAWGVLSAALLAGPALLLSPSPRETGSARLIYWSSKAGYIVLALVVAKLFLYDLAAVDPILRILLFCGFGTAFLLAAYLFGGERSRTRSDT